jgi:hypothetical protein
MKRRKNEEWENEMSNRRQTFSQMKGDAKERRDVLTNSTMKISLEFLLMGWMSLLWPMSKPTR